VIEINQEYWRVKKYQADHSHNSNSQLIHYTEEHPVLTLTRTTVVDSQRTMMMRLMSLTEMMIAQTMMMMRMKVAELAQSTTSPLLVNHLMLTLGIYLVSQLDRTSTMVSINNNSNTMVVVHQRQAIATD
jgi:hypothetical protein